VTKSPHSLDGPIIHVAPGVAIYRTTSASPFYYARIRDRSNHRYVVRSTKETSRLAARQAAEELALDLRGRRKETPREYTFRAFATRYLDEARRLVAAGERNPYHARDVRLMLDNRWGLMEHFSGRDVREVRTRDFLEFMNGLARRRPDLSPSSRAKVVAAFRGVLRVARDEGVIDAIPATPRPYQKDSPRPFFRFYPLVPRERDSYQKLLRAARDMAAEGAVVRGTPVTGELYDLILFVTHSFVRPTTSELYALRHADVEVARDPKRLLVTVRRGKTGFRIANTMPGAVSVFERIKKRHRGAKGEDYLFLPQYKNRVTASRIVQRQFRAAMDRAGVRHDPFTDQDHTVYSLRHTSLAMRMILSEGRINVFNLARTAGTSVEQLERFYLKHLPTSKELARNLQSFGGR
jgi:hypothetical protein